MTGKTSVHFTNPHSHHYSDKCKIYGMLEPELVTRLRRPHGKYMNSALRLLRQTLDVKPATTGTNAKVSPSARADYNTGTGSTLFGNTDFQTMIDVDR